jgi:hypothetical protein
MVIVGTLIRNEYYYHLLYPLIRKGNGILAVLLFHLSSAFFSWLFFSIILASLIPKLYGSFRYLNSENELEKRGIKFHSLNPLFVYFPHSFSFKVNYLGYYNDDYIEEKDYDKEISNMPTEVQVEV